MSIYLLNVERGVKQRGCRWPDMKTSSEVTVRGVNYFSGAGRMASASKKDGKGVEHSTR